MKAGVIGCGLSGLGCAYYLQKLGWEITLFDSEVAGGASAVAAGIIHPFVGRKPKLHPFGAEGIEESLQLIQKVEKFSGQSFFQKVGILRFIDQKYEEEIKLGVQKKEYDAFNAAECEKEYGVKKPAIFLQHGGYLNTRAYLLALFNMLEARGAIYVQKKIESLSELASFSYVVVAAGAWSAKIRGVSLDLRLIKGQLLVTDEPILKERSPARMGSVYALNTSGGGVYGATYESTFLEEKSNAREIEQLIKKADQIGVQLPLAYKVKASIRAYRKNNHPVIEQCSDRLYAMVGLGSRGLLLHALFAKKLVDYIMKNRCKL